MHFLRRVLREPILHFLLIGALLFGVFALVSGDEDTLEDQNTLAISTAEVAQLASQFRQTWRRAPAENELRSLMQGYIREEVLVREALSLSMDVDDPVIRRRLAQKMEFLITSGAAALVPSDEELKAHYQANIEDYSTGAQIAFEQVYLGPSPTPDEVTETISALENGAAPDQLGQRTLLPPTLGLSYAQAVENAFGSGFFTALSDIAPGEWRGPVPSGYGFHAVRVTDVVAPAQIPLEEIRTQVETDWRAAAAEDLTKQVFAEMEARYQITTPSTEDIKGLLQ